MVHRPHVTHHQTYNFPIFFWRSGRFGFMGDDGMVTNPTNLQNQLFSSNFYCPCILDLFLSENHEVGMILPCVSLLYQSLPYDGMISK